MSELTRKELKEILHYDPETGVFTRIKRTSNSVNIGDIVSCKADGYVCVCAKGKQYRAHILAWFYMTGEWPKDQIDHIDHVRDNNIFNNLREATHQENGKNQSMYSNNTSGVTGVTWFKRDDKWQAQIKANSKNTYLGCFIDKFEAICARKSAENKYGYHENHGNLKQT
jgi:hypothetical protein